MIYFDNAATSYPKPDVVYSTMNSCARNLSFNVGRGQYDAASNASSLVEITRNQILEFFDYPVGRVIFSPSATHALNIVLQGQTYKEGDAVYISPFEHNAIRRTLNHISSKIKLDIHYLSVTKKPFAYNLKAIAQQFADVPPKYVFVSHASNVCGAVAPLKEIFSLAKLYGAITVTDTAQSAGHIPISMKNLFADYLVFAGHKAVMGPIGIGGIVMAANDDKLKPSIFGGTGYDSQNPYMPNQLPSRLEAGSLNVVAIAGLSASLQWITDVGIETISAHEMIMLNKLQMAVESCDSLSCIGVDYQGARVGVLSCVSDMYLPDEYGLVLDKNSICVRTGLHCAPDAHKFFGTFPSGAIRFSVGWFTTDADIDELATVIHRL